MAGRIIIGGRLNLTVSFISSLSSPGYLPPAPTTYSLTITLSLYLRNLSLLSSRPFSVLPTPSLSPSPLSFALSEFCAELPAIIIIALLPIISTTPLRNCTSMLLIHFLFGQRGVLTVDEKSQIPLRNFRPIESFSSPPPTPTSHFFSASSSSHSVRNYIFCSNRAG